jgi:hypothetical protein
VREVSAVHDLLLTAAEDATPAVGIGPLHRHKRVVVFTQLRARVRTRRRSLAQQHVEQRQRCNSRAIIIAAIGSTSSPSLAAAALKSQTSTHLVSVYDHQAAIVVTDSHEEAVAPASKLKLVTGQGFHPLALGRPAFVRHAAGGCFSAGSGSGCFEACGRRRAAAAREGGAARKGKCLCGATGCRALRILAVEGRATATFVASNFVAASKRTVFGYGFMN